MITKLAQLDLEKSYTYADYLTWQLDEMVELIRGKIFKMSPAPSSSHQEVSSNLHGIIWNYLRNQKCNIYAAPFDVRLPLPKNQQTPSKINTVVQPDLSIICDLTKVDEQGCNGAPDWVIEILSPTTSKKDHKDKFEIYQNAGVREYWLVYPNESIIATYTLGKSGLYQASRPNPYVLGEEIQVGVFEDLKVKLDEVFE